MSNSVPHRSRAGVFATGAFGVSAIAYLVVLAVDTPTLGWWKALVIPGFLVCIPLFGLAIWRAYGHSWRRIQLFRPGGWRPWAVAVLAVAAVIGVRRAAGGPLNVVQQDGGYFFSDHGRLRPATRRDWQRSEASMATLFASVALLFDGIAALALTQARPPGGATAPTFRAPKRGCYREG